MALTCRYGCRDQHHFMARIHPRPRREGPQPRRQVFQFQIGASFKALEFRAMLNCECSCSPFRRAWLAAGPLAGKQNSPSHGNPAWSNPPRLTPEVHRLSGYRGETPLDAFARPRPAVPAQLVGPLAKTIIPCWLLPGKSCLFHVGYLPSAATSPTGRCSPRNVRVWGMFWVVRATHFSLKSKPANP